MSGLVYFDRTRGEPRQERVYAHGLLHWLYNTRTGAVAEALLSATPHASRLYGWLQRRAGSRRRIASFVRELEVDLTGAAKPIEAYASFHDFFTRELRPGARPLAADPEACLAPVDGKVLAFTSVSPTDVFRVKRSAFSLQALLADEGLAASFAGGTVVICRLALADYHHFHFPDSGQAGEPRTVAGAYHAGGPYARRHLVPFFAENARVVTPFASDHFGPMALVEVGALTVGSIRQRFRAGRVERGQEKGWFEPGGSTVVMVFAADRVEIDADILERSARDEETYVHMGEAIGRRRAS